MGKGRKTGVFCGGIIQTEGFESEAEMSLPRHIYIV